MAENGLLPSACSHGRAACGTSALPPISEPTDYFKEPITGSGKVPRRRGRDAEQKPGFGIVGRRVPCRKRRRRHAERRDFARHGYVRCSPRQFQQYGQAGRGNLIGANGCLKAIQQRLPLGGIGALRAAEMAYVVALVHELGGRELHRGARGRRETRRHVGEPGDQFDRRDQKAKPNTRTDRLAERTDVNDASIPVERRERRRGPT